ncbi:MAG: dihydropteroate synthase [Chthoniobacterales bacterium]
MIWKIGDRALELSSSGCIMGILNVTPDSFADGGNFLDHEAAFRHASAMVAQGAAIIDVGGESSRPGSDPVALDEELRRVIPVIRPLRERFPQIFISIDTYKAVTAKRALEAGADIVNDITALRGDPEMATVVRHTGAGVILMHMKGSPKTMQLNPYYSDVVAEVFSFLKDQRDLAVAQGIPMEKIAIDPGFGFGKRLADNVELARNLDKLVGLGHPIVVGISKKSPLAQLLGNPKLPFDDRVWPTVAFTSFLREKGAKILRVHEVKPNLQALRMTEAILAND